jgi:hypothetical protein
MVDNNRGRFFLAVEPAYADLEYVFFISSRWYHMLLGLTAAAVQECAQPHLHSGRAPYYKCRNMNILKLG